MKRIKFLTTITNFDFPEPKPASRLIPEWFRKLDGVVDGIRTIKKCMPFLDAFTTGYMITLAADIYVDKDGIQQISKEPVVMQHDLKQLGGFEPSKDFLNIPYKWINFFVMKTPRGYSTMFTHPLNRIDLPFYTLSGVVETDNHPVPVNFPFLIRKDFEGIIPAGTPIIQAIPFKRTSWEHSVDQTKNAKQSLEFEAKSTNPPFDYYKKHFWSRKTYK